MHLLVSIFSHPNKNGTMFYEYDITWMAMYQMTLGSYNVIIHYNQIRHYHI